MENLFSIDYLTFTVKVNHYYEWGFSYRAEGLMDSYIRHLSTITSGYISDDKFKSSLYGRNHFDTMYRWADKDFFFLCASQNNDSMKNLVQVCISGQGVKELGTDIVYTILYDAMTNYECKVSRIDICYDDYMRIIPLKKLVKAFKQYITGNMVISSNYGPETANIYMGAFNKIPYENITFGSRTSGLYFRLYDKRAEQQEMDIAYWYRMELELRREVAQACAEYIVEHWADIQTCLRYFLNRMFKILSREPTEQEVKHCHISRIPVADWWLDFIQTEEKAKVVYTRPSVEKTVDQMLNHIRTTYAGYLRTLAEIEPDRLRRILEVEGKEQAQKPQYKRLLQHYDWYRNLDTETIEEL